MQILILRSYIMQEHIHPRQIICGHVQFLSIIFYIVCITFIVSLCVKKQRTWTHTWIIDWQTFHILLSCYCYSSKNFWYCLWRIEFSRLLTGLWRKLSYQIFICISKYFTIGIEQIRLVYYFYQFCNCITLLLVSRSKPAWIQINVGKQIHKQLSALLNIIECFL